jgi:hypothetical protein
MKVASVKGRVLYDREKKTSKTRTLLWDSPELRKAFRTACQREKGEADKAKAKKKRESTASCSRRWRIGKSGQREQCEK